jgi:hypothetical protein
MKSYIVKTAQFSCPSPSVFNATAPPTSLAPVDLQCHRPHPPLQSPPPAALRLAQDLEPARAAWPRPPGGAAAPPASAGWRRNCPLQGSEATYTSLLVTDDVGSSTIFDRFTEILDRFTEIFDQFIVISTGF